MPRLRKVFIRNSLVEICFRTEEGLPLVASHYMRVILLNIFARAQSKYPVKFCHGLVMSNHMHLLVVVNDPTVVDKFVGYIKRETSHAINRLMGRKKKTIWSAGYDSTIILDMEKAIERIVHLYVNPQTANLVLKIEDYPNFSTWQSFLKGGEKFSTKHISRGTIKAIARRSLSLKEQKKIAKYLLDKGMEECSFVIEPNAWLNCFKEEAPDLNCVNKRIVEDIRKEEKRLNSNRKVPVIGSKLLRLHRMDKEYMPKKRVRKTICLSSSIALRASFISWYKTYVSIVDKVKYLTDPVTYLSKLPPGLFAPGGFVKACLLPNFIYA